MRLSRPPAARIVLFLLAMALAAPPRPALAWGPRGHRTIARIAQERLSPAALRGIRDLLDEGDDLADVANWADREAYEIPRYKASGPWHFVNVPITADRYGDRYCRDENCVVAKIGEFRRILADADSPRRERLDALRYLVHLVGDIHQPLHVGDHNDRGGNGTQVQFLGQTGNFHRVWDSGLIEETGDNDRQWAERIRKRLHNNPAEARRWAADPVETWADESLQAAKLAYRGPLRPGDNTNPGPRVRNASRLERDYHEFGVAIVEDRLARAAVRLAHELDAIWPDEPGGRGRK
ncbi:MAG: S1/P1 nuclease [Isosphaeraceae bacterium]